MNYLQTIKIYKFDLSLKTINLIFKILKNGK